MQEPTQLDQSALQDILGGSTPSLIPESLITTLTVGFIVLNVLGILFFVFFVIGMIRKWKVESATLHMQKDIADIKAHLLSTRSDSNSIPRTPVQPAEQNRVIAQSDSTNSNESSRNLS